VLITPSLNHTYNSIATKNITVYNVKGQQMQIGAINIVNENMLTFKVNMLAQGVYYVKAPNINTSFIKE
jgi:hypothetical protein